MKPLLTEIKTNMLVQFRNKLYHVGFGIAVLVALMVAQIFNAAALPAVMAGVMILIVGGSTLLYVAAMILFERDEGTIRATLVTPLSHTHYIVAKIVSLTFLASAEAIIMFGGAMAILAFYGEPVIIPNIAIFIIALFSICLIFVLMGIILVVRYKKITDFIMPMALLMTLMQIPVFYFVGAIDGWWALLFPVSPPTLLMLGAFSPLEAWQYIYAIIGIIIFNVGLFYWTTKAFEKHIAGEG